LFSNKSLFILLIKLKRKVPILAAGGVFTGQQVAAALALGADGVVVGSAFLASPESLFSPAQKEAVLKAGIEGEKRKKR
jgi:NAD(P)H-dependent flavin oxidoreductase YrpB (nitropropane dioxygenase family)